MHYTYRITNIELNKHYYGVRTTKTKPNLDLGIRYFSSSSDSDFVKDQKANPQNYIYKIIRTFSTRKEAIEFEIKLHNKFDVGVNESFYNRCKQTSTGFDTSGTSSKKLRSKEYKISNGWKPCIICGKLHNKKYCCSKLCFSSYIKQPNNEYSKNLSKSRSDYIINNTEKIKHSALKSAETTDGVARGKKISETKKKNNSGNNYSSSSEIRIYNQNGEVIFISPKNRSFAKFCKTNNLPLRRFQYSYKNNVKMHGNYKNWYAVKT